MLMLVRARPDAEHTTVYESQWLEPKSLDLREYIDSFGNRCWRLTAPGGPLQVRYDAVVDVADEPDPVVPDAHLVRVDELPDDALVFTLPSRYVQSDLLLDSAWQLFGDTPPTWARVQAVVEWVHTNVRYETGSSMPCKGSRPVRSILPVMPPCALSGCSAQQWSTPRSTKCWSQACPGS